MSKPDIKKAIKDLVKSVEFKGVNMGNDVEKTTDKAPKTSKNDYNRVIMGIGQLFVVVSIAYSTAVIFMGVDGVESKIALFPQAAFASYILIKAFSRLYK